MLAGFLSAFGIRHSQHTTVSHNLTIFSHNLIIVSHNLTTVSHITMNTKDVAELLARAQHSTGILYTCEISNNSYCISPLLIDGNPVATQPTGHTPKKQKLITHPQNTDDKGHNLDKELQEEQTLMEQQEMVHFESPDILSVATDFPISLKFAKYYVNAGNFADIRDFCSNE